MKWIDNLKTINRLFITLPIRDAGTASATLYGLRGDLYKHVYIPESRTETEEVLARVEQVSSSAARAWRWPMASKRSSLFSP